MKKRILFFIGNLFFLLSFSQTNTWTGAIDTDWHKGCNWSLNHVPTCTENVIIPNTTTNKPTITGVASCLTIDVQGVSSTLLTINTGGLLQVDQCPTPNTVNLSGAKYIFVSTNSYNANTSVASRDAACATDASGAGLPGTYKAWISNGTNFSGGGGCGYMTPNNDLIATSYAALTNAGNVNLLHPIDRYANNSSVPYGTEVYTGLNWNGAATGSDCSSWTSTSSGVNGTYGFSGAVNGSWTNSGTDACGTATGYWTVVGFSPANCHPGPSGYDNACHYCTPYGAYQVSWSGSPCYDDCGATPCATTSAVWGGYCGYWTSTGTNPTSRRHYCIQQ